MTEICRFAYAEVVNLTKENMLDVLFAASKFQMKFLMEKTIDFICKDGMNEHSVFKILELNQKDSNMRINLKCFEYIQKNHDRCFKSSEFLSVDSDLLRAIMQTCKIPRNAAKTAIALWSAFPDNADEDLDELIALVSLNDEFDENANNVDQNRDSKCESISSSRAGSSAGDRPNRQRQNPKQQRESKSAGNGRGQKNMPNVMQQQMMANQQRQMAHQQHVLVQQSLLGPAGFKNFLMRGNMTRRHCSFANLNLHTLSQPISIVEFQFVYDLSSTDKEFDLHIYDLTGKKTDLFYSRVSTADKIDNAFTRYRLQRPCLIGNARKIWISIEFLRPEHRLSFGNFNVAPESVHDRLALRHDGSNNSSQVISNVVFSDSAN